MSKEKNKKTSADCLLETDIHKETSCIVSHLWVLLFVIALGIGGFVVAKSIYPDLFANVLPQNHSQQEEQLDKIKADMAAIEKRVLELENKEQAQPPTSTQEVISHTKTEPAPKDELTKLKDGVKTLFEASESIGSQLKAVIEGTRHTHSNTSYVLAYMNIKDRALQGMSFKNQLEHMRTISASKTDMQTALDALQPFAMQGVATHLALYDEWISLVPKATNQIQQSEAKNWKDRVSIAVKSLVTVKPLKGSQAESEKETALLHVRDDLLKGDIAAALEKTKSFDTKLQKDIFIHWTQKAEERLEVEKQLSKLSEALLIQGQTTIKNEQDTQQKEMGK